MRSALFISILALTVFSCAKKTVPAASAITAPSVEPKAPDELKIAENTKTESAMSVAGHATYDAKCGRCHGLKNVADYTAKQWVPILNEMAPKARLDSTEKANVLAYVNFYAKAGN